MKRAFDIVAACGGLILLSPLLVAVGLCVLAGDGWPVLFRQTRVGRHGCPFTLLKFRSMSVCARAVHGQFDAGSAARVTRIGRVLRAWKLDELPQLWNVLAGDMSFVGPRPEVAGWVQAFPERWARVLAVRPGITDPASIEFRNEEDILARAPDPQQHYRDVILPRKLDLYEQYVARQSFVGDIRIILRTVLALAHASHPRNP